MHKAAFLPLLALLPLQGHVRPEEPSRIFAVGDKGAVVMAPADFVASAYVRRMWWTGDGSALLVQRLVVSDAASPSALLVARQMNDLEGIRRLSRRTELVAWSPRTRRSRLLLAYDPEVTVVSDWNRVPNSDRFYTFLRENLIDPTTRLGYVRVSHAILSVGSGSLIRVPIPDPTRVSRLEFSPKGAAVLVQTVGDRRQAVTMVNPNGTLGRAIPLPERAIFDFEANGSASVALLKLDADGKRRAEWHTLNLNSGVVGPVIAHLPPPEERDGPTVLPNTVLPGQGEASPPVPEIVVMATASKADARSVYLSLFPHRSGNMGLVTLDGTDPLLSPKKDAVAYLSGGSAFVRTLARLSLPEYAKAAAEAERELLVDRGRQLGVGLAMYAADADDALPPLGFDVTDSVFPYVRSRSVFDGFVPTFGGELPKEGLGTLAIGYISGPGGRVVIYADGSVKWVPEG